MAVARKSVWQQPAQIIRRLGAERIEFAKPRRPIQAGQFFNQQVIVEHHPRPGIIAYPSVPPGVVPDQTSALRQFNHVTPGEITKPFGPARQLLRLASHTRYRAEIEIVIAQDEVNRALKPVREELQIIYDIRRFANITAHQDGVRSLAGNAIAKCLDLRHRDKVEMNICDPDESFHYVCSRSNRSGLFGASIIAAPAAPAPV